MDSRRNVSCSGVVSEEITSILRATLPISGVWLINCQIIIYTLKTTKNSLVQIHFLASIIMEQSVRQLPLIMVNPNLSITIRAIDYNDLYFDKNFTVEITNVAEADLDEDGIEDLHDLDTDGDGVSNILESIYGTDSKNKESFNLPPNSLFTKSKLRIKENQNVGKLVGEFQASDPDDNNNLRFSISPLFPDIKEPIVWLDGEDELSIQLNDDISHIKKWKNKAGSHHDFVQNTKSYQPKRSSEDFIRL